LTYEEAIQIPISLVREKLAHPPDHLPDCKDAVEYVQAHLKLTKQDDTRADAVRWLGIMFPKQLTLSPISEADEIAENCDWHVAYSMELQDLALYLYLKKRGIKADLAKEFLKQISLHSNDGIDAMYVMGYPNEEGGFALLGPYLNILIGTKAISFIRRGEGIAPTIHIFTDFMDMLAAFSAFPDIRDNADIICLNSPELIDSAFAHIRGFGYRKVYSWFPNNFVGLAQEKKLTALVKTDNGLKHMLSNDVYKGYNDVATWRKANFQKAK